MKAQVGLMPVEKRALTPFLQKSALLASIAFTITVAFTLAGCGSDKTTATGKIALTGTPWVPNVAGSGATNHDASVAVNRTVLATATGPVTGLAQGWSGREISVTVDMTQDLGTYGSLSLVAEVTGFPAALKGGAFAVLTSLSDGTNELINLARTGTGGDCAQSGAYTCTASSCSANTACSVSWPSAYSDRTHWEQHQINSSFSSYESVNTFPTCNYSGGTPQLASDPSCAFNSTFLVSGKLRSGVNYTAKYILLADNYSTIGSGQTAGLQVSVIKKTRTSNAASGAVDLNVVFVGGSVSQASRNAQGKVNLDSLFAALQGFYAQSGVNIKLGTIRAVEWTDDGQPYADLATTDFGTMIGAARAILPVESDGKAINIYLVDSVTDLSTLLGMAGGIGGPPSNGYRNSGVVVSTFGKLDQYNASCTTAPCSLQQIDFDFANLEQTVAHEMGHYMGLNHPSESQGTAHDITRDTPICTTQDASLQKITINSCLTLDTNVYPITNKKCSETCLTYNTTTGVYCPAAVECEFNYMMYWSSKHFKLGTGAEDGNIFSAQNGQVMNFNPLVQ